MKDEEQAKGRGGCTLKSRQQDDDSIVQESEMRSQEACALLSSEGIANDLVNNMQRATDQRVHVLHDCLDETLLDRTMADDAGGQSVNLDADEKNTLLADFEMA